jgi:MGT family glycosyltransferase
MPKALFFNVPAHGHINPSLPLVAELVRRGHQITYFATEHYRARIEATGAIFQPYKTVQDDYFESQGLHGGVPAKVAYELIRTTEQILPELIEFGRAAQPDYVIFDGMCPWGNMVARILAVPAVASLSLMPLYTPPPSNLLNWDRFSNLMSMIFTDFGKGLEANKLASVLGKKYNIPALGLMNILNAPADLAISYTSRQFQPFADSVSKTVRHIGRIIDAPTDDSFSFERVKGRKLVYVSLGTINNNDIAFFRACIDAFAGSEHFVILTTGNAIRPEAFGTLPENIAVYGWVPQFDILKRASLFISHAGLNSVHDGLYFGVPLLLVPQQGEQFMIGERVVELGGGLMLKKSQVNAETLRTNAARLLSDARFKTEAQKIGETFRTAGGASKGADEIEALIAKGV